MVVTLDTDGDTGSAEYTRRRIRIRNPRRTTIVQLVFLGPCSIMGTDIVWTGGQGTEVNLKKLTSSVMIYYSVTTDLSKGVIPGFINGSRVRFYQW
jgi:hypothetical protein